MKKTLLFLTILLFAASAFAEITLSSTHFVRETEKANNGSQTRDMLFEQLANVSAEGGITSQDFEASYDQYDAEGADDFVVPAGETWTIDQIIILGTGPTGPIELANIRFYEDNAGMPGTMLYEYLDVVSIPSVDADLDCAITPTEFTEGTYWLGVQGDIEFGVYGQWFWNRQLAPTIGYEFYWKNPGDGFGYGFGDVFMPGSVIWPGYLDMNLSFGLYGTSGAGGDYCEASTTYEDEYIGNVTCVEINNTTGFQGGVGDYTAMSASIEVGTSADIFVTNGGNAYVSDMVTCWVDWNDDYTFALGGDEEFVLTSDGTGAFFDGAIAVPAGTSAGLHRMRVRMTYSTAPDPCGSSSYGEVEDYSINVVDAPSVFELPFTEGFEGGVIPTDWSQEYVIGTVDWAYQDGGNYGNPAGAHSGVYNAFFYDTGGDATKLITPQIDMGTATDVTLTFWHTQAVWAGDQDNLRVYYKNSAAGAWTLLAEYLGDISAWTEEIITLPDLSGDYYVAFEGLGDYGYGVCVDDILIDGVAGLENDFCEGAIAVVEGMGYPFDTTNATTSGFDTHNIYSDLWFVFTPDSDGTLYFGTCDTGFDTKIALYGECDVATELGYNDDSCGLQSELFDIPVTGGEDYYMQIGGYSSGNYGPGLLDIIFTSTGQPIIGVDPMTINETLEPEEVVVIPVTIENTGTTDLTFDITVVETSLLAREPAARQLHPVYDPANAESDPMIVEIENPNVSDALFDLQFQYACYDAGGEAGVETDGDFIYVPLWNGSDYLRYNMDGTFVEYFTVAGTASVRDLAYDGQYFYGAAANNSLFEMDFTPGAEVLVSTITAPVACRAIAYDDGADGFWANNWSDTITLFDRSGTVLNTLTMSPTYISYYGFAYDDFSDGGPYLWGFSQTMPGGILVQYDIAAGGETGVVFDVGALVGSVGSAGGMFIADGIVPGFTTIGVMCQNEFIVGLELTAGDEPWITVTPLTGVVAPGASEVVAVTLNAEGLVNITKTADIMIANNAGDDVIVDVTMVVEDDPTPEWDPPTAVAVDDYEGIVTWAAPAVGGVIAEDNFDSYAVGDYIAEVGDDWTTWSNEPGGAEDALVTDVEASSPSNSVVVELNQDLVLIMADYTSGIYTYEMKMFVPTGYCGYYNIQKTNVPGTEWAFQIYFQTDGTALADAGSAGALTYAFNHDEWMDLKIVIDLDSDWAIFYHDGVEMIGYQYSLGCFGAGALLSFGGVNIFGGANSGGPGDTPMFYFDDVILSAGAVATRDLTGYNVYLDGALVETVGDDVFTFTYEGLETDEEYTAGVSAVYDDGESEIIEVVFIYTGLDAGNVIIAATKLNGNYPNPFNPVTNIAYSIKEAGKVTLEVYNIKGQLVKTLVNDVRETGNYTVTWNGRDNSNKSVASGVYFYKMKAQNYNNTKKMILMK